MMRIAVIGAGTAGSMAAAHLSHHFPDIQLTHVFDPDTPTIGVGEGTSGGFWIWLQEITGITFDDVVRTCHVTPKRGVRFEGWGQTGRAFTNDFVPFSLDGLHISADHVVTLLARHTQADLVPARVTAINHNAETAEIALEGRPPVAADLVVDARGFPRTLTEDHLVLPWIPTNTAAVARGPVVDPIPRTRAVARPHGWIFVIPLAEHTSYGYVYNAGITSGSELQEDFDAFLAAEGVDQPSMRRTLGFPNFVHREAFAGRVMRIGNAASFVEPLEATAIGVIRNQLLMLSNLLRLMQMRGVREQDPATRQLISAEVRETALDISLFVGWHYARGAPFDTPFWAHAANCLHNHLDLVPAPARDRFNANLAFAQRIDPRTLAAIDTTDDLPRILPGYANWPPYRGISAVGYAQVLSGLR